MQMIIGLLLPGFVLAAAIHDIRSFKIPNPLIAVMLIVWPLAVLGVGATQTEIGTTAALALVSLLVGIGLFAKGWIGAGDVKLIAATVLYVGSDAIGTFFVFTALCGAVLALGLIMFRRIPLPGPLAAQGWLTELHARTKIMPYGVAIAAGALIVWGNGAGLVG